MKPEQIVDRMMLKDQFSHWLGIERLEESPGYCILRMTIRPEMCNGFDIAHGGICYSLADSALAFASNSQGRHALSIETSISHFQPCRSGDILTAKASEVNLGHRIAIYEVQIFNQDRKQVALFKGTVYRKEEKWE